MLKNNKGFTLVELLVTIGLITVIVVISSDFLLNLVSATVRIQNKATLEQNYSFITSKLVKLTQEADDIELINSGKVIVYNNNLPYLIELKDGELLINNTPLSYTDSLVISSTEAFSLNSSSNPIQLKIKLNFDIDSSSSRSATQNFERIVTVRKSYKN